MSLRRIVVALSLAIGVAACSVSGEEETYKGCTSNADCNYERVCQIETGKCVDPVGDSMSYDSFTSDAYDASTPIDTPLLPETDGSGPDGDDGWVPPPDVPDVKDVPGELDTSSDVGGDVPIDVPSDTGMDTGKDTSGDSVDAQGDVVEPLPILTGHIVYRSTKGLSSVIRAVKNDGSEEPFDIVETSSPGAYPACSPKGSYVAFRSEAGESIELFRVNGDGGGLKQLTFSDPETTAGKHVWSPDGEKIAFVRGSLAFVSSIDDAFGDLFVMNSNGSGLAEIGAEVAGFKYGVNWSQDNAYLVFNADQGLHVAHVESGVVTALNVTGYSPVYSPNGNKIAYLSQGVHVVGAEGSDGYSLHDDFSFYSILGWKDDSYLLFVAHEGGKKVFGIDVNSTDMEPKSLALEGGSFTLSPDGKLIGKEMAAGQPMRDIYTSEIDGSSELNLTNSAEVDEDQHHWCPQ